MQLSQPGFRRRATAAPFRGEEFYEMRRRRLAGKGQLIAAGIERQQNTAYEKSDDQKSTSAHHNKEFRPANRMIQSRQRPGDLFKSLRHRKSANGSEKE